MTLVSAAIATYNRESFIDGAIESVERQTYDDVEIIIVNDGSTDGTKSKLEKYSNSNHIKILHNKRNEGQSISKNKAAFNANGKYIAFLDDDDRWHPRKIEKEVKKLEQVDDDFCAIYTGAQKVSNADIISERRPSRRGEIYPDILTRDFIVPFSSVMVKNNHFRDVDGFDSGFDRAMDWDLFIRLGKKYKFEYIDKILVDRIIHDNNISQDQNHAIKARQLVWDKHKESIYECAKEDEFNYYWDHDKMLNYIENNHRRKAVKYAWKVMKKDPGIMNLFQLVLAGLGSKPYDTARGVKSKISKWEKNT